VTHQLPPLAPIWSISKMCPYAIGQPQAKKEQATFTVVVYFNAIIPTIQEDHAVRIFLNSHFNRDGAVLSR